MDLKQSATPQSSRLSTGVVVSLVVVLILIAIILILAKSGKLNQSVEPNGEAPITDAEKAEIIRSLQEQTN